VEQTDVLQPAPQPMALPHERGSCNGCDIELIASLTPRYDAEQLGVRLEGSPRHADILCVTGPITHNAVNAIKTVYGQVCGQRLWWLSVHACDDQRLHRTAAPSMVRSISIFRSMSSCRLPAASRRHHPGRGQGGRDSGKPSRKQDPGRASGDGLGRIGVRRSLRLCRYPRR